MLLEIGRFWRKQNKIFQGTTLNSTLLLAKNTIYKHYIITVQQFKQMKHYTVCEGYYSKFLYRIRDIKCRYSDGKSSDKNNTYSLQRRPMKSE